MKRLFLLLSFLLVSSPVFGADFYVAQTSAGSGNGSSCANAYAYTFFCSSGNWANPKQSGLIGPGDIVHLCGTISSNLVVQKSGSNGSPITILFESSANLSQPCMQGGLQMNNISYITVDGGSDGLIQSTLNGTAGGACPGGACAFQQTTQGIWANPCNNCEIKNLTIANMYVRTSTSDEAPSNINESGIGNMSGSNFLVHNNTFHDMACAIGHVWNNGDTNVQIYDNNIYNVNWGEMLSCPPGTPMLAGTISIYGNHIHDYANWDDPVGNYYHHNGIHAFGSCQGASGGIWIYNNIFDGNPGLYVTGHIFFEQWTPFDTPLYIFNNVFNSTANNAWVILGSNGGSAGTASIIVNNTFLNGGLAVQAGTNPIIKNNYFSAPAGSDFFQVYEGIVTFANEATDLNYNYYCECSNSYCWDAGSGNITNAFATWKTYCDSCDGNSVSNLTGTGGINTTSYLPSSSAPVIGAGANLTSLGITALNSDAAGTARPSSGAWDIGAYEYTTAPPPPPPPPPPPGGSGGEGYMINGKAINGYVIQ